jgi:hypothetical protein
MKTRKFLQISQLHASSRVRHQSKWSRRFTVSTLSFGPRETDPFDTNITGPGAHPSLHSHGGDPSASPVTYGPLYARSSVLTLLEVHLSPIFLNKAHHLIGVSVLVDSELWTDESVFWQNKLQDRAKYEVVYRTTPAPPSKPTEVD